MIGWRPCSTAHPEPLRLSEHLDEDGEVMLRHACRLSLEGLVSKVNYTELAAFRRIFKRATGISPLQYRQRFRSVAAA